MSITVVNDYDFEPDGNVSIERLYPHIAHSTFISLTTNVWLANGSGEKPVDYF